MTAIRDFLVAFTISTATLMVLISIVFLGSRLMNEFFSLANAGPTLLASFVVAVILAIPMAAIGISGRHFDFAVEKAA